MAFKPIDPKRDEFRRYLERAGVIEALTKAFVRLIKDKPENPMEYLKHNLGDAILQADDIAYLNNELEEARAEIQRLRSIIESVNPDALQDTREESSKTGSPNITEAVKNGDLNPGQDISAVNETTASPSVKIEETPSTADSQAENTIEEAFENVNIDDNVSSTPVANTSNAD